MRDGVKEEEDIEAIKKVFVEAMEGKKLNLWPLLWFCLILTIPSFLAGLFK